MPIAYESLSARYTGVRNVVVGVSLKDGAFFSEKAEIRWSLKLQRLQKIMLKIGPDISSCFYCQKRLSI